MSNFIDLKSHKFSRLTVVKYVGNARWLCKCDCGNEKVVYRGDLKNGATQSCGCLQKERTSQSNSKHRLHDTRLYNIWCGMKQRCKYKKHVAYKNYGGRGIAICEAWSNDFKTFYEWSMDNGYSDNLTIDRINNDGNYEPSNCRWTTPKEQFKNQRVSSEFINHMNKGKVL